MTNPNETEIEKNLNWLIKNKGKLRNSTFGDDNNAQAAAAIIVLQKNMTEDEVYNQFDDGDPGFEGARYAAQWLSGDDDISPIDDWSFLVR